MNCPLCQQECQCKSADSDYEKYLCGGCSLECSRVRVGHLRDELSVIGEKTKQRFIGKRDDEWIIVYCFDGKNYTPEELQRYWNLKAFW